MGMMGIRLKYNALLHIITLFCVSVISYFTPYVALRQGYWLCCPENGLLFLVT